MQQIFTKTTSDGRAVVVCADVDNFNGARIADVKLAGKSLGGYAPSVSPLPDSHRRGAVTHFISCNPPIALTTDEAAKIEAALSELYAGWLETDDGRSHVAAQRIPDLLRQRDGLIAAYQGLCDEQADQFERAHARQDATAWQIKERYEARIESAAKAVRDFDAAHPNVVAAIKAERAADVERALWM